MERRKELIKAREYAGYSIRELADLTKINKSRLSEIELGKVEPNVYEVQVLCRVLRKRLTDLLPELVPVYLRDMAIKSTLVAGLDSVGSQIS